MTELHFLVQQDEIDGGYIAQAVGVSITTQGETEAEIKTAIADAVECHFTPEEKPKIVRLHYSREEVLALA